MRCLERKPARRLLAFTLIELLVVMGVLVILLTLLIPTLHKIRERVAVTKIEAMVNGISMALDQYRTFNNVYPPDKTPTLDKTSEALAWALSGASIVYVPGTSSPTYPWRHAAYQDTTADGSGRRSLNVFYEFKSATLIDRDADLAPEVVDHWGKRLIFNTGSSVDGNYNQYGAPRRGLKRFDIFSAGPDKLFGTADDITSWGSSTEVYNDYNYNTLFNNPPADP